MTIDVTERGRNGGLQRAENHSKEELSQASSTAALARWKKYYEKHPDKLAAKLEREKPKKRKKKGKAERLDL